jgi:EPS-associated MarR family transcriptional regulator
MTRTQQIQDDMHYRVLALVEANPAITQRALAAALGVSLGRVNYGLRALVEKGLIKVNNFKQSETKLTYAYLLTPSGVREKSALTKAFLARKMEEFDALRAEIEALQGQVIEARRSKVEIGDIR